MSNLIKIVFKDTFRGLLVLIISLLIVCPLSIFFLLVPFWEENRAEIGDWVLIAAGVAWMTIFLGGMAALIYTVSHQRKKWLDSVFTPLGLSGRSYLLNWWEYRGLVGGRELTAQFYKGPTLRISIQTRLKTRFGITEQDQPGLFLADLVHKHPLVLTSPELKSLAVFALDETWTGRLLESQAVEPVLRLMKAGETWALIRQLILQPGQLTLMLYRNKNLWDYNFTADEVRRWVEDMFVLLHLAESLPPPVMTAEENPLEKASRTGQSIRSATLIVIGFLGLCAIGIAGVIWLLVAFLG
jgi:hypothetical protein